MTDVQMTVSCANAMGLTIVYADESAVGISIDAGDGKWTFVYNPLVIDAQALDLVKKFGVAVWSSADDGLLWYALPRGVKFSSTQLQEQEPIADLNRAIVECVAKMQFDRTAPEAVTVAQQSEQDGAVEPTTQVLEAEG